MKEIKETFTVDVIDTKDLDLIYEQIVQTAVLASAKTADGRDKIKKAINNYIKYACNKRGVLCTYSFISDNSQLSREDKYDGKAHPNINNIEFTDVILTPRNLEEFASCVSVIERELQHMVNHQQHDFYTNKNPFGLKMEYFSHKGAFSYLTEYVKHSPEAFSDEVLLNTTERVINFFDDSEVKARTCGLTAMQKFLKDAGEIAQNFDVWHIDAESIALKARLHEQETNAKKLRILEETQREVHTLLYRLQKDAVDTNNPTLAEALAETQDIKQLYNPMIYKNLLQFAIVQNHKKLALMLDNSKYGPKVQDRKLKSDIKKYVKSDAILNNQDAFNILFNHDQTELANMFGQAHLSSAQTSRFIIAQEYTLDGPALSSDAQSHVDKIQAKTHNTAKHNKDKIIVAEEVLEQKKTDIIVAKEVPETNKIIVAKEEPNYDMDALFEGNEPVLDTPEMTQEKTYDVSKGGIILPNEVDPDKPRRKMPRAKKIVESPLPTHPTHEEDFSRLFEIEVQDPKLVSANSMLSDETILDKTKKSVKKAKQWIENHKDYDGKGL